MPARFLFFLFVFFSVYAHAAYDYNKRCIAAFDEIVCLRFHEAQRILSSEKKDNPDNLIPVYLENYIDFLKVIISEEEERFDNIRKIKDDRIKKLSRTDKDSPYYRYIIADIHLQYALMRLKFNERITAVYEVNKAYKLLNENLEIYPDFLPSLKGLSVMHALIGTIPDDYQWITQITSLDGTVKQGIEELDKLIDLSMESPAFKWLQAESIFLMTFIALNLESDKTHALLLQSKYYEGEAFSGIVSQSPLISFSYANLLMKTAQNDKAIRILQNRPGGEDYFPFHYLDYLLGLAKLRRLDEDAFNHFYYFVINFNGINYIKSAYQKIAWYFLVNGSEEKYEEYMHRLLYYGDKMIDQDKQAEVEAERGQAPDLFLLRARLLFDGGYYKRAEAILISHKDYFKRRGSQFTLEYTYRLGRIYHEWNKTDKAIPYYKETIREGNFYRFYFIANAALELANIYESRGDFVSARYYYIKCLTMNPDSYKGSMHAKAKAGLNRINEK